MSIVSGNKFSYVKDGSKKRWKRKVIGNYDKSY